MRCCAFVLLLLLLQWCLTCTTTICCCSGLRYAPNALTCCHCTASAAVVFDMHYNELLLKGEEIERLKSVIEGLGGTG
jgi:hypothetical protein